jgi:hypothetical protein
MQEDHMGQPLDIGLLGMRPMWRGMVDIVTIEQDFEQLRQARTMGAKEHAALSRIESENKRLDKARHAAIEIIAKQNDDVLQLVAENERLRAQEEPLRTLYRFVMESWYARNLSVPSGVLERARQALGTS